MAPSDDAERWVTMDNGTRFWGTYGAAGTLIVTQQNHVLLQLRAQWTHFGGTWGLPGGARKAGESAEQGALREFSEEVAHPPVALSAEHSWVMDREIWSYTTVLFRVDRQFQVAVADSESEEVAWVSLEAVADLPLHPGLADSWSKIRAYLLATASTQ